MGVGIASTTSRASFCGSSATRSSPTKNTTCVDNDIAEPQASTIVTVLHQIGSKVPSSEMEIATLRANLIRGGFRSENAVPVFFGLRIISHVGCWVVLPDGAKMPPNADDEDGAAGSGLLRGWILPRFFLEKAGGQAAGNPAALSARRARLLVVSVEAGLGLDQAIQHVAKELQVSHPQLSEEMSLVMLEMRAGKRRSDALRNFAERTGEDEIASWWPS
jgi:tight adherence protein C